MKLFLSHKYGNNLLPSKFTEQELSKFKEESKKPKIKQEKNNVKSKTN